MVQRHADFEDGLYGVGVDVRQVLLTGASGAIGARVLNNLARNPGVNRIVALQTSHEAPVDEDALVERVVGDMQKADLGLGEDKFGELSQDIDTIIHCAERLELDSDLASARAANVAPLSPLFELLKRNQDCRLVHVSTTLVAGDKRGLFTEFDLSCGQEFHNAYEQSKFEAECLIHESEWRHRIAILRRSLTIDDIGAVDGRGTAGAGGKSAIGFFLDRLRRGRWLFIASDPRMFLDVVPPSYVTSCIVALAAHPEAGGKTVHCVAGVERSWTMADMVARVRAHFHRGRARFFPPQMALFLRLMRLLSFGLISIFPGHRSALRPYFRHRSCFDDYQAQTMLAPLPLPSPTAEACLEELLSSQSEIAAADPERAVLQQPARN